MLRNSIFDDVSGGPEPLSPLWICPCLFANGINECGSEKRVLKAFQQLLQYRHLKKTHKMAKFQMLLYYLENVPIA